MDGLRVRKIAVWSVAVAGAVAPAVMFWVSLSAARRSQPLNPELARLVHVAIAPGVVPGLMTASWVVQVVVSGLFWCALFGAAGAAALVKWRDRGGAMRGLTISGAVCALYGVWLWWNFKDGWDPH